MLRPRHPAAVAVDRGFRRLSHGDVHYRAAGVGPAMLALHESPRSSLSMLPVIEALAGRFRVIAPDTPGYGLSDALPGEAPPLDAFVQAIAELLDSLGLQRVPIYGAHTGAALALAFAHRHPERVSGLVLDGVSAFTPTEVEAFRTRYLAPYAPSWDGAHVMKLWSRVKDLFTWFPWYAQTVEARLGHEPPGLAALDRSALGFLQAGADYAKAYIHAAAYQPGAALADLTCPVTIMARPDDLIADHLSRITPGPTTRIRWLGPTAQDWRGALDEAGVGLEADEPSLRPEAAEGSRFVRLGQGWLHAVLAGPADGPLRLLLPGLPGDILDLVARQRVAHPQARLLALSPPGCGWSDPLAGPFGLEDAVEALHAAFQHFGDAPSTVCAEGASVVLAERLVETAGWSVEIDAIDPPAWTRPGAALPERPLLQPREPRWDGAHLTAAWFQLRDLQLYDTPPSAGAPVRRGASTPPPTDRLDRLFRSYVEGPDCAALLDALVEDRR